MTFSFEQNKLSEEEVNSDEKQIRCEEEQEEKQVMAIDVMNHCMM